MLSQRRISGLWSGSVLSLGALTLKIKDFYLGTCVAEIHVVVQDLEQEACPHTARGALSPSSSATQFLITAFKNQPWPRPQIKIFDFDFEVSWERGPRSVTIVFDRIVTAPLKGLCTPSSP